MKNLIVFVFCLASIMATCQVPSADKGQSIKEEEITFSYSPTVLPMDISQLWIGEGEINADTVLIINEGGPTTHLGFEVSGKTNWAYLPNYKNYYRAHLHQSGTFNKDMFSYEKTFTKKMAEKEVDNNSEMLFQAIKYFKERNKTVIVFGHSYGAFIIPHYLSTRPSIADKYFISAGRIDVPNEINEYFFKGINKGFLEDGKTVEPAEEEDGPSGLRGERYHKIYRVKQLIKGVIGEPRYSNELKDVDLSNVVYYYATNDTRVGTLTQPEIDFLKSKNVQLKATHEGHYEVVYKMIDDFRSGALRL